MTNKPTTTLKELDTIADVVLSYRPKPKTKPARKRQRRRQKMEKINGGQSVDATKA